MLSSCSVQASPTFCSCMPNDVFRNTPSCFILSPRPRNHALNPLNSSATRRRLGVRSLDAAQPYDYESQISDRFAKSSRLKIGIIGFGNFGQFLAKTLARQGHTVLAHSRTNYADIAYNIGVSFFSDVDDLCEEHPEVYYLGWSCCLGLLGAMVSQCGWLKGTG